MKEDIKVSIIIPTYNVEKYIEECLNSLVKQTFKDFEIICVDDGSKDNTLNILNRYAKDYSNFKVVTQTNQYAGVARNNGMQHAKGKYLLFLDSDDFFELDLLELTYNKAIKTSADVVLFNANVYDDIKNEFNDSNNPLCLNLIEKQNVFSNKDTEFIYQIIKPYPWVKLYKASFVFDNKICFSKTRTFNDIYFYVISLACAEKITYVDEKLVHYRRNTNNSLQDYISEDNFDAINVLYDAYLELIRRGIYNQNIEFSFNNAIIKNIKYNVDQITSIERKMSFIKNLVEHELYKKGFFSLDLNYYTEIHNIRKKAKYLQNLIYTTQWIDLHLNKNYDINFEIMESKYQNNNPTISVIIPVYNTQLYIKECLDSIVSQSFNNIEIIIVNDGSSDNSLSIIQEYLDKEISLKILNYNENMGVAYARNLAIKQAKGQYLYIMDSDGFLELNAFELIYPKAIDNDLDLIFFDGSLIFEEETVNDIYPEDYVEKFIKKKDYSNITTGLELFINLVKNKEYLTNIHLFLIKRDFFLENNLWFEQGIVHVDNYYTFSCLVDATRVSHITKTLYNKRLLNDSMTNVPQGFYNVYSYFINYQAMLKKYYSLEVNEKDKAVLFNVIEDVLKRMRNVYSKLDENERAIFKFMDVDFKFHFKHLVEDYVRVEKKNNKNKKEVLKLHKEIRKINDEMNKVKNSRSYQLVRKLSDLKNKFIK